jgi:hypothetical protein
LQEKNDAEKNLRLTEGKEGNDGGGAGPSEQEVTVAGFKPNKFGALRGFGGPFGPR